MIKRLVLQNFKSHSNTVIEFNRGYNVIVGSMGSGKTSVIEGIVFALFGTTQSVNSRKIQIKDLIMSKPIKKEFAKVELILEKENCEYKIVRELYENKSSQARIELSEKIIAGPKPSDVNLEIENLFGINIDTFMRANYSEQNQIDFFLNMQASFRKQLFDSIFGIDFYDNLSVNSRHVANRVKDRVKEKENLILELKSIVNNYNLQDTLSRAQDIKNNILKNEEKIKELELEFLSITKKNNEFKQKEVEHSSLNKDLNNILGQMQTLKEELGIFDMDINYHEKIDSLNLEKENIAKKIIDLETIKTKFENSKIEYYKKIERVKNLNSIFDKNKLEINNFNVNIEYDVLVGLIEKINKEIFDLEQDYAKEKKEFILLENKIFNMREKFEEYEQLKIRIERIVSEDLNKKYDQILLDIKSMNDEITKTKINLELDEKNMHILTGIHTNCPVCESILSDDKKYDLINKKMTNVDENKDLLIKLNNKLNELNLEKEKLGKEIEFFNKNILRYDELTKKYFELNSDLENHKKYTEKIKEYEDQLVVLKKEQENFKIQKNDFDRIRKISLENSHIEKELYGLDLDISSLKIFIDENLQIDKDIENIKEKLHKIDFEVLTFRKRINYIELSNLHNNINKRFLELNYNKLEHEQIIVKHNNLNMSKKYILEILEQLNGNLVEINKKIDDINNTNKKLEFEEKYISKLTRLSDDLMIFSNVAKKTQEDVRELMIKNINTIFMDIWPRIYPYSDFEKIALNIVQGDYRIEIYFNGHKRNLDDFVSGGERSSIALTLRIAMALVMRNSFSVLILDEPTHNLDKNAILELSNFFNNYLLNFIDQIFVITHDKSLENSATNVYNISRDKNLDSSSIVEYLS